MLHDRTRHRSSQPIDANRSPEAAATDRSRGWRSFRLRRARMGVLLALLLLLAACGAQVSDDPTNGDDPPNGEEPGTPPLITEFQADPDEVAEGESSRLTWSVDDADTLVVNPGAVDVTAEPYWDVTPTADTTYTLEASNEAGTDEATVTVQVEAADAATTLSAHTTEISFPGTTEFELEVEADGSWTAETDQEWIVVTPDAAVGDQTVTVEVDRSGLDPAYYAGSVLFRGAEPLEVVTVAMRFPALAGTIIDADGGITTSAATTDPDVTTLTEGVDIVPGEVLVAFDAPLTLATARGSGRYDPTERLGFHEVAAMGLEVAASHDLVFGRVLGAPDGIAVVRSERPVAEAIADLERDPRVRYAVPNTIVETFFAPNDPHYSDQWHYDAISMEGAWDVTLGDPNVVVAVIDSGFHLGHEDLVGQWVDGFDFTGEGDSPQSDSAACALHGTHVAGTIGAATNNGIGVAGVAPGVGVMPLKIGVYDAGAGDCALDSAALIEALYHVGGAPTSAPEPPSMRPSVVNLSLGSGFNRVLDEAIAFVTNAGITVVAAAGNDPTASVSFPAAFGNTIAVSALDHLDALASYSTSGAEITVAAPGGDIDRFGTADAGVLSTVPTSTFGSDYGWFQGTSMAAPHVAGVVGLMASVHRDLTPSQVLNILAATATDLGPAGRDTQFGYGKVHAADAVLLASDTLEARADDVVVQVWDGASMVASVRADPDGRFAFGQLDAGTYDIEAGTDPDGDGILGSGGSFFVQDTVVVDYDGDVHVDLVLERR